MKADLDVLVYTKRKNKERFTSNGFFGMQADSKIDRGFSNVGTTAEGEAEKWDIPLREFYKKENWVNGEFHYGGHVWRFNFTYTNDVFERIA